MRNFIESRLEPGVLSALESDTHEQEHKQTSDRDLHNLQASPFRKMFDFAATRNRRRDGRGKFYLDRSALGDLQVRPAKAELIAHLHHFSFAEVDFDELRAADWFAVLVLERGQVK